MMLLSATTLLLSTLAAAQGTLESDAARVQEGHWVEVRGTRSADGVFVGEAAEILVPQEYEVLIGTVEKFDRAAGWFTLLGRRVTIDARTRWRGVEPSAVQGARVKVEGFYGGQGVYTARIVSTREAGRERVGGTAEDVRRTERGIVLQLMDFTVVLPQKVEHQVRFEDIPLAPPPGGPPVFTSSKEDEQFGAGLELARGVRLTGQLEFETTREDNFDLDAKDNEDRVDYDGAARMRLAWLPNRNVGAVIEVRGAMNRRADEEDGPSRRHQARLGQTWVYTEDPFGLGLGLQLGRQDFEDQREWIYDENLDAIRIIAARQAWRLELSTSTIFAQTIDPARDSTNWIAHLSNNNPDRLLASYVVHRRYRSVPRTQVTHVGVSASGDWLPDNESWLEAAIRSGSQDTMRLGGWGFDLGTTWRPSFLNRVALTGGYAFGTGDDSPDNDDHTFRQTGLHDNNARFNGVTSFRYYGELMDPELANLRILTGGIGARFPGRTSLDVVYHAYRQHRAARALIDAELDQRPDGVHRNLGWETDVVFGSRPSPSMDFEVVVAYFRPGTAFARIDPAYQTRVQIRYRF